MITRVEVILENETPQDPNRGIRCKSVAAFDENEERTDYPGLSGHKEYDSKLLLVREIARELDVKEEIIEIVSEDTIKDDADTQEEELYNNGSPYPYEMPREVDIREDRFSIFECLRKLYEGKILFDQEYHRYLVWTDVQRSRFIESILLNIPIPPLYVRQEKDGKYIIVDGQQRISTILEYSQGGFKLSGLSVLYKLNGKTFNELEPEIKAAIEDKPLPFYIIKLNVPMPMVYEIFDRINTGGTQPNRQEIRNRYFFGKASLILTKLSKQEYFKLAIDYGISFQRMKDREAILRYLAFKILDYKQDYKGDMDDFLGAAMKAINRMNDEEIAALEKDFQRVMKSTYDFFGPRNFRLPTKKSKGRINIALMESIGHFFSMQSDHFLQQYKAKIKENYNRLLLDSDFIQSVTHSTGDRGKVIKRFDLANRILGDV